MPKRRENRIENSTTAYNRMPIMSQQQLSSPIKRIGRPLRRLSRRCYLYIKHLFLTLWRQRRENPPWPEEEQPIIASAQSRLPGCGANRAGPLAEYFCTNIIRYTSSFIRLLISCVNKILVYAFQLALMHTR